VKSNPNCEGWRVSWVGGSLPTLAPLRSFVRWRVVTRHRSASLGFPALRPDDPRSLPRKGSRRPSIARPLGRGWRPRAPAHARSEASTAAGGWPTGPARQRVRYSSTRGSFHSSKKMRSSACLTCSGLKKTGSNPQTALRAATPPGTSGVLVSKVPVQNATGAP